MSCLSKQNLRKKCRWVKSRQRKSFIVTKLNNWSWVWFSYFYRRSRGDAWQGQNQDLQINFYEHVPCRNNSKDQHQNEIGLSFAGWKGKFKVVWTFHILPSRCMLFISLINGLTWGVERILDSYADPRLRLGFAELSIIVLTPLVFRWGWCKHAKMPLLLN